MVSRDGHASRPPAGNPGDTARRDVLRRGLAVATLGVGLAGCGDAGPTETSPTTGALTGSESPTPTGTTTASSTALPAAVVAERVGDGFVAPVAAVDPDDGSGLRYVADQVGVVYAVTASGGGGEPRVALDLRDRVVDVGGYDERGLLGLALHPDFPDDDRLFVRYSAPPRPGTPSGYSHTFVLASVRAEGDGTFDADSERAILEIPEPQSNHNGGPVTFGPDGFCYLGVGDGGGGGDRGEGHVADWYDRVDGGNGQDVASNLLGSVLRIDVDAGGPGEYGIPSDNPLVGSDGLDEHYAWGLRNPWGLSFTGEEFFVADVGQSNWEEVNLVTAGGNYGWNVREGAHCYAADDCPRETPDGEPLKDPILEYPHGGAEVSGVAVVGGYLYRGERLPGLDGRYVFADWQANGRLFVATRPDGGGLWPVEALPLEIDGGGDPPSFVLGFGREADGSLLVCGSNQGSVVGESGAVYRLTGTA